MSAIQQLDDALQERNKKTNAFVETIIDIINQSVKMLPSCTPSNSTPEVAGSVKVLKKDLDNIIAKIRDNSNIDEAAAARLVSRLQFSNVKKNPDTGSPRSSTSSAYGTPRSSETGSPRSSTSSYQSATGSSRSSETNRAYPIVQPNADGEYDFDQPPRGGKTKRR